MSSNIYDNDCSIIKQPVTIDEFRKEIDLLKEEIANLKKAKNKFIIDLEDIDEQIEEEYKDFLLDMKSLLSSNKWEIIEHGINRKFKGIRIEDSVLNEYNRNHKINYYFNKRHLYFFKNHKGVLFNSKICNLWYDY
jgi:cytochrome oxidase Cu insertion factor (SCO1/SenC/PrrC family)